MPCEAANACSSSYDTSLTRCAQTRPCAGHAGGSTNIAIRQSAGLRAQPPTMVEGTVEEQPPRADEAGVHMRLVPRSARTDRGAEVDPGDPGPDEPRHTFRAEPSSRDSHGRETTVGSSEVEKVVQTCGQAEHRARGEI